MGLALDVGYASLLTAAAPYIAVRAARTGRYREGWAERVLGRVPELTGQPGCIWMHGVSLGEVQLLRPLVERFNAHESTCPVVLSTSTLTGMQVAKRQCPTPPHSIAHSTFLGQSSKLSRDSNRG